VLAGESIIAYLLKEQAIELEGKIKTGLVPEKNVLLSEVKSAPLSLLIWKILKKSNNLYTEAILLKLAATYYDQAGDWTNGTKAVKKILQQQVELNLDDSKIADGSGLSRYSLISPEQLIKLLAWMYQKFPYTYEFIAALPTAGREGTLEDYPLNGNLPGYLRAKTGSMTGIFNLAGYLTTKQQKKLAFVIMINGFNKPVDDYIKMVGQITDILAHSQVN